MILKLASSHLYLLRRKRESLRERRLADGFEILLVLHHVGLRKFKLLQRGVGIALYKNDRAILAFEIIGHPLKQFCGSGGLHFQKDPAATRHRRRPSRG